MVTHRRTLIRVFVVIGVIFALIFLGSLASDAVSAENHGPQAGPSKYLNKTAKQWHARAVWRTKQRNKSWAAEKRLRTILKYEIQVVGSHPLERSMLCIHSYEGSWTDPNAPYWGGMQMDRDFMRTYGRVFYDAWGTADNWPISVQLAVSMEAYLKGRGFYPWPNTARYCGLIG